MPKLYELLAVEGDLRSKAEDKVKEVKSLFSSEDPFLGIVRHYNKLLESEPDLPNESKQLPHTVDEVLQALNQAVGDYINVTIGKEVSNADATAEVEINGKIVTLTATALLNLESRLDEIKKVYAAIPTLSLAEKWTYDDQKGCYVSEKKEQLRTVKTSKTIVLYEATKEHPAQVQLVNVDLPAYKIESMLFNGMIPETKKRLWLQRIDALKNNIKQARQRANSVDAITTDVADEIFLHITK